MTSRIVSRLSALNQILVIVVLASIPALILPVNASASTDLSAKATAPAENKPRLVFEIKNFPTIIIPEEITIPAINLNSDKRTQTDPEVNLEPVQNPNITILENYLKSKNSPLADYSDYILKHQNWKLVIAISNGESGLCKRQLANNCWGITRSKGLERYESFAQAITDADYVINKYVSRGADTPEEMLMRYVGWNNQNWVRAANQILAQLDQLPLVN